LRRIVGGAPDAEFYVCRVIMEIVHFVIYAVVLAVGAGSTLGRGFEPAVLNGIIIAALWMPFQVIAQIMYHYSFFLHEVGISREIWDNIIVFHPEARFEVAEGNAAYSDLFYLV